jgi:hypothetical protein
MSVRHLQQVPLPHQRRGATSARDIAIPGDLGPDAVVQVSAADLALSRVRLRAAALVWSPMHQHRAGQQ